MELIVIPFALHFPFSLNKQCALHSKFIFWICLLAEYFGGFSKIFKVVSGALLPSFLKERQFNVLFIQIPFFWQTKSLLKAHWVLRQQIFIFFSLKNYFPKKNCHSYLTTYFLYVITRTYVQVDCCNCHLDYMSFV